MSAKSRIEWTPAIDAAIVRVYRERHHGGLKKLSCETGIGRTSLSDRARRHLGLMPLRHIRTAKKVRWTPRDDELIVRWGHEPAACIARRLVEAGQPWRSDKTVSNRRCELRNQGQPVGAWQEDLTAEEIADGLRVSITTVTRWINRGLLQAKFLQPHATRNKLYRVKLPDLRRFFYRHPTYLASARPDLVWYNDIVFGPYPSDVQEPPKGRQRRESPAPDGIEFPLHLEVAHD